MTEFTKEELQIILLDMDTYIAKLKMLKESPSHRQLRLKIQTMIEKYCEHDWQNHCCSCVDMVVCEKCNQRMIPDE
jgi:hypothetical protein